MSRGDGSRDELWFADEPSEERARRAERYARSFSSGKTFEDFLRETPAKPLDPGVKILLWSAGGLTALLFLISLYQATN